MRYCKEGMQTQDFAILKEVVCRDDKSAPPRE